MTVPRQIYFHTATRSVPLLLSVFSPKKPFSSLSLFFCSPDQTRGPTFHPIPLFLSHHLSIHLSFIPVSSRSLVGAERWQACVCLALLSAFLMNTGGQPIMEMRRSRQAKRWRTSLIGGPLLSSTLPSYLSRLFPLFFSPLLTSFLLLFFHL